MNSSLRSQAKKGTLEILYANGTDLRLLDRPALIGRLAFHGAMLLRGFAPDAGAFSDLVRRVSRRTTMDPARVWIAPAVQEVDAGHEAVGLHCENGTTPCIPDLVWFLCIRAAQRGSRTTLCDGRSVWDALPAPVRNLFKDRPVRFERRVPEERWVPYMAWEFGILPTAGAINQVDLDAHVHVPGVHLEVLPDRSLFVRVDALMVHPTRFSQRPAWANSLLGPSYNYEEPRKTFADGSPIPAWALDEIRLVTNRLTLEVPWEDGDVLVIDNTRVMHGRQAILDPKRRLLTALGYL